MFFYWIVALVLIGLLFALWPARASDRGWIWTPLGISVALMVVLMVLLWLGVLPGVD